MKLKLNDVSVSFGDKIVLSHINFEANDGDKIAIVGRNGCGKTTLLKVIMGKQEIDAENDANKINRIEKIGTFKIGYMEQVSFEDDNQTMLGEILKAYSNVIITKQKMERLEKECEVSQTPKIFDEYIKSCEDFDNLGGYTYQKEVNIAIKNFGFTEQDKDKKLKEFSGGQQTKIAFIKLLLSKPDLLILDEPTNHLDINAIEWLENYLSNYKKTVIVVSHDRAFIDKFVNIVYEIERHKITCYKGDYSSFVTQKQLNYQKQLKDYNEYKNEVDRLQTLADRFRYKATKAKMAQSKLKQIDKMEVVENPEKFDTNTFHADIKPFRESGTDVINFKNVMIGYDKVLSVVNFKLSKGDRIGIIGANGLGKSTFLKTIVGKTNMLGGKIIFGTNVDVGYFDQFTASSNINDETVLENYQKCYPDLSDNEARSDLGAFMFRQDDVFKNLKSLSGGELVRLEFCKIFKKKPNTLLLDEPTNHLDIAGKEALEDMLLKFKGTILFVSHDRYFINKLATSLLVFENGDSKYYPFTTYNEYMKTKADNLNETNSQNNDFIISNTNDTKSHLNKYNKMNTSDVNSQNAISYNLIDKMSQKGTNTINDTKSQYDDISKIDVKNSQKESKNTYLKAKNDNKKKIRIKRLEQDIAECESTIAKLQENYQSPDYYNNYEKMRELDNEIMSQQDKLDNLMTMWESENSIDWLAR